MKSYKDQLTVGFQTHREKTPQILKTSVGVTHFSRLFIFHITSQTFDAPFIVMSQGQAGAYVSWTKIRFTDICMKQNVTHSQWEERNQMVLGWRDKIRSL